MRKGFVIALVAIMILSLGTMAFAKGRKGRVDNDSYVDKYSEYEQDIELGAMADIIVYEDALLGIPYAVGAQSQYDFSNKNWGFYGKVSLNLSPMIKNLLGAK
jgi:hypothetical protein